MKRYTFIGQGPITGDHRDGTLTGELVIGDVVTAAPLHADHPNFLYRLTNVRNGFTMLCPPQDLQAL